MSFTTDLLDGLARVLVNAGIGVYSDNGYAATDTGIGIDDFPQDCPRAIAITDYSTPDDSPDQPMTQIAVQVLTRGLPDNPFDAKTLRDQVFLALHGITGVQFGSCGVDQCLRRTSMYLGVDDNRRAQHSQNFYIDTSLPATPYRA